MKTANIISGGVVGTTAMTLFSYLVSAHKHKNFKEPLVLSQLTKKLMPALRNEYCHTAGWAMHYGAGIAFTGAYSYLWENKNVRPGLKNALLLGAVNGVLAVGVWKSVFRMHPNPPAIHFNRYYGHLVMAHLVFATFATMGYHALESYRCRDKRQVHPGAVPGDGTS
ncbi:hypothetical protein FW774_07960 [Pedobacter sp. BS3]|uniref:hypothetical protein n=1 Tax=Pedobacter sp. BS3 TaxID=2567937 RepID=UPI0011F08AD7|nr:hypothetical protein [Pedobacter sp. BS3]TZF84899.1 hypothetical protein FW774_07960 [Pedobacter sp. BS3]